MKTWLTILLVLVGASPAAAAEPQRATANGVEAVLTFGKPDERTGRTPMALAVTRRGAKGAVAIPRLLGCREIPCAPMTFGDGDAIRVRDLDADGEPEVLLDLYTGGAHCCLIGYVYRWTGTAYEPVARDFADLGYRLAPLSGDGRVQFITGDARFGYRWAAFAFSLFPEQILDYDGASFVDVTAGYPDRIRRDVRRDWQAYRSLARQKLEVRGAIAAWAANRYRLGERTATLRELRQMARRGRLKGFSPRDQAKFVRELDAELQRWGYRPTG